MMERNQELKKNAIIFGIGTFGAKLMQFILIPLYTIYLSTSDYGTSDIISSTVTMLIPFLTLGMAHGILRFVLGQKDNRKPLLTFSIKVCLASTAILFLLVPFLRKMNIYEGNEYFIPILFLFISLKKIFSNYCKAIEKNKAYAIDGIVAAITTAFFSWLFLGVFHFGVQGYLTAILIANVISVIYFSVVCDLKTTLSLPTEKSNIIRESLKYSVPLMPNDLAWWIIQMSDRYMVTWMCGAAVNGVYTMAYKIPGIFNIIVSVFIQAFNITVFKECDINKQKGKYDGSYFESIYSKYLAITFVVVIIVILITQPVAFFMIKKDFYLSWKYTPYLLIAFAIGNLESFLGSILGGIKRTKISFVSTFLGSMVNIILNYLLISRYQTYGAIIATVVGYFIVYLIRIIGVKRYVDINLHVGISIISLILIVCMAFCYTSSLRVNRVCSLLVMIVVAFIYRKQIYEIVRKVFVRT